MNKIIQNNYSLLGKVFYTKTKDQPTITSDDFRELGLEQYLDNETFSIGGFFRYLSMYGHIVPTGKMVRSEIPSSHYRKITVWKWSKVSHDTKKHCGSCVLLGLVLD
jgi:hypothetical protein